MNKILLQLLLSKAYMPGKTKTGSSPPKKASYSSPGIPLSPHIPSSRVRYPKVTLVQLSHGGLTKGSVVL